MDDAECVFCRIVASEEPAAIVRTDERTIAFMTIQPATEGHVLVVPRRHARNLFDIDASDLEAVACAAQEVAIWQRDRLRCSGVSLYQANEPAGFQSVFHYHVHVVPRYQDDAVRHAWSGMPMASNEALQAVATRLRGGAAPPQLKTVGSRTWLD
jgi:histidine triad (HIT) family protein